MTQPDEKTLRDELRWSRHVELTRWMHSQPTTDEAKERAMTKETTIEKGKTTVVEEEQTEQTETQPEDDDGDDTSS